MSPASTTVWILLMTAALALSGCSGAEDDTVRPVHSVDEGHSHADPTHVARTPTDIRIPAGASTEGAEAPWFEVDGPIEAPASLRITNEDDVLHRVVAEFREPAFAPDPKHAHGDGQDEGHGDHGDGHGGGHGHAGTHGGGGHGTSGHDGQDGHAHEDLAFDVSLQPGESIRVDVAKVADIAVHCHPHPWMVDTWPVVGATNTTYDVTLNTLNMTASTAGDLRMGHDGDDVARMNVTLSPTDLVAFTATLRWDDADDDGPLGGDANGPDAFRLTLIDPAGAVAAEDTLEARTGTLMLRFEPELVPWPDTVDGRGEADAMRSLRALRPADGTWSGLWSVQVELLQAPGFLPADVDDGGAAHDAPEGVGFDGHQSWDLDLVALHAWPSLGGGAQETQAPLPVEDGHEDHEH